MNRLDIDSITKSYGPNRAIDSMSFSVEPGQIFGFVGANGAGKTTTMRIAVGVLDADSGRILWDGRPLTQQTAERFGYMPEERGLYPKMTVAKQLTYLGCLHGLSNAEARQAMLTWTERLRIDEHRSKTVDSLSLGNQQRVQLAAALLHEPDLLVLDEPFSGLDPIAVDDMSEVLREAAVRGAAVLFSSHQLELVERLCDVVGIVQGGKMLAWDTLDTLRDVPGASRLYLELEDARENWADQIPAIKAHQPHGRGTLLELAPRADENDLLLEAVQFGRVREMAWHKPTLTQLFRDLVEPAPALETAS
ncbi:ABC transporter ATP-binding protein [Streptacidiphilus carbonis]|uniref:ABC transporter ATP-binding protein n=1 Tax=Streptacidiphilus carbonis TaxID=105422 RepID=UPI0005AA5625|nr:ATP-binding cassette domain-containing protein [Streptacidiphilus carbonis]